VFKLFQSFKLQQFAHIFADLGFAEDIYKLSMLGARQKTEILEQYALDPNHKEKFNNLFARIEALYPRKNVNKTIDNARKIQQTQQKYGVYNKDETKGSVFNRPKSGVQRSGSQARQATLIGNRAKSKEKIR